MFAVLVSCLAWFVVDAFKDAVSAREVFLFSMWASLRSRWAPHIFQPKGDPINENTSATKVLMLRVECRCSCQQWTLAKCCFLRTWAFIMIMMYACTTIIVCDEILLHVRTIIALHVPWSIIVDACTWASRWILEGLGSLHKSDAGSYQCLLAPCLRP